MEKKKRLLKKKKCSLAYFSFGSARHTCLDSQMHREINVICPVRGQVLLMTIRFELIVYFKRLIELIVYLKRRCLSLKSIFTHNILIW